MIKKNIWPQKGKHGNKSKEVNYRNLARKLFAQEADISDCLKDPIVFAHYRMTVKNQISKLKKRFKIDKKMLCIIGLRLLHKVKYIKILS